MAQTTSIKHKGWKWSTADASNPTLVMVLDNTSKAVHITDAADASTDWNVSADSDPAVYIHSATSPATNYIKMYNNSSGGVIDFSGDVTLTHTTDILKFSSSANDTSRADGYGFFEFDVSMTGTATGHFAATSAWVNIGSGVTPASGGDIITPRTDGIWEDAGATLSGARLAFGARMQAILGDSDFQRLTIWSLNTNQTITAVYDAASPAAYIGRVISTPSASAIGTIPFIIDSNGTISYIYLYAAAS